MPKPHAHVTPTVMCIHWCMTILVPVMLLMSTLQLIGHFGQTPQQPSVLHHILLGVVLFIVLLVRRQVRRNHPRPSPPSGHMSAGGPPRDEHGQRGRRIKQPLAWMTWATLLSGITLFVVHMLPGPIFLSTAHLLRVTHILCTTLVAVLTLVHILDALFHQLVLGDGAINRMFFASPAVPATSRPADRPAKL